MAAILEQAVVMMMLHACGLADRETGRVVALVAASGTGRTTASTSRAKTWGYVTDETVAIRDNVSVAPHPKPLSLKQAIVGPPKTQVEPMRNQANCMKGHSCSSAGARVDTWVAPELRAIALG